MPLEWIFAGGALIAAVFGLIPVVWPGRFRSPRNTALSAPNHVAPAHHHSGNNNDYQSFGSE